MLDMELSLLRLACWEILRLPGLCGLRRTFAPPDSWVNTPGVDSDRGRDIASEGTLSRLYLSIISRISGGESFDDD